MAIYVAMISGPGGIKSFATPNFVVRAVYSGEVGYPPLAPSVGHL